MIRVSDAVKHYFDAPHSLGASEGAFCAYASQGNIKSGYQAAFSLIANDKGQLQGVQYHAYGCPFTLASCAFLAHLMFSRDRKDALRVDKDTVIAALSLPAAKHHCAERAVQALQRALERLCCEVKGECYVD